MAVKLEETPSTREISLSCKAAVSWNGILFFEDGPGSSA